MMDDRARAALGGWLVDQGLAGAASLEAEVLTGGQSNPTFRIRCDAGEYVLRKRPPGELLASAHAIDREYRVLRNLADSRVPVPAVLGWCADASIVGTEFYLMAFLEGRVFTDQSLPGLTSEERDALYREMNCVMAALHEVDPVATGLEDFGRPGNYVARQIARWTRQCEAATLKVPPALRRLMDWLPRYVPTVTETRLVHGDYRMDNLLFHPTEPRVLGVLDWELSTLGDPLADFAYHCMAWRIPPTLWRGIAGLDLRALGIPDEAAYVERYEQATGRVTQDTWEFYMAFNLFRMAAILHGIAQRAVNGNAASSDAADTGRKAAPLAELGWACAQRYQAEVG